MVNLWSPGHRALLALMVLMLFQNQVFCFQYKVGDLDSWGIPTIANPDVYSKWSKYHTFKIRDSLLFFYPPSQDSVLQVTQESYKSCKLKDPILYMNNGNSLFNITKPGNFFFISGEQGHCEKKQKMYIYVSGNGTTADSPSYGPSALPQIAPSYPTVFGSIPAPPSSSPSQYGLSVFMAASIGALAFSLLGGFI